MLKIGVFLTGSTVHQIGLWRRINARPEVELRLFFMETETFISALELHNYQKQNPDLSLNRLNSHIDWATFFKEHNLDIVVSHDCKHKIERQLIKAAHKNSCKIILYSMTASIALLHPSNSSFSNLILRQHLSKVDAFCLLDYGARWHLKNTGISSEKIFISPGCNVNRLHIELLHQKYDRKSIRKEQGIKQKDTVFLFYHNWENYQEVNSLTNALTSLKAFPNICLIFICDNECADHLYEDLIPHFKGRLIVLDSKEVDPHYYFSIAEVFIMSSIKDYWGEVASSSLLWSLPTIANNSCQCGSEFIIDGYTGFSFYEHDDGALVHYMKKFIKQPDLITRFRDSATQQLRNYSVENSIEGFLQAVDFVMKEE